MQEVAGQFGGAGAIATTLRGRIIPALLNGQPNPVETAAALSAENWKQEICDFTQVLVAEPAETAAALFEGYVNKGIPATALFSGLLAGVARRLGELWVNDECSFADVTIGMTVVHRILREHAFRLDPELEPAACRPTVLVTTLPGEDHVFAATMLAEHFRAAQWRMKTGMGESREKMLAFARMHHFDIVAISASCDRQIENCRNLIRDIRKASSNKRIGVLVGGPPFDANPKLFLDVGADATASNAVCAVERGADLIQANKAEHVIKPFTF